jgi:hypothetical protein
VEPLFSTITASTPISGKLWDSSYISNYNYGLSDWFITSQSIDVISKVATAF